MWTPDKNVGDEVLFTLGGLHREWERRTIVRETATQFILSGNGGFRIRKKDGRGVGSGGGYATDLSDAQIQRMEQIAREDAISHQAFEIHRRVQSLYYSGHESREWLVKHIGPLLQKEGE